ncbi:MAG: ABC transporter ATP-binding protein [Antricoccus sp.]
MTYPDGDSEVRAVDHVSLTVAAGELVAITGASGSGKSTLLAVAGALQRPTSGSVTINGASVDDLAAKQRTELRRTEIGFIFQQSNLISSLNALEQVEIVSHLRGKRSTAARQRAEELLDAVGLSVAVGRRPHQLSGGQRQRVAIARALINSPAVLLVDEPTSALDSVSGGAVLDLISRLTRLNGTSTVLVTHDMRQTSGIDRMLVMSDGSLEPTSKIGIIESQVFT